LNRITKQRALSALSGVVVILTIIYFAVNEFRHENSVQAYVMIITICGGLGFGYVLILMADKKEKIAVKED
jgi:hypothetical protein